jgi:lipid A ethanolaminephosphotransferase
MLENLDMARFDATMTFFIVLVALFVVNTFFFFLFSIISHRLVKYFTLLMVFLNPIALYFIFTYNIILDRTMMGNLFNTNSVEALSYYHPKIFLYIGIGFLLAYLLSLIDIKKSKRVVLLKYGLSILVMGILILYLNASKWLWLDKHAKNLGAMAMPWSYVINSIRYEVNIAKANKRVILLPDANLSTRDKKMIVILVIGESARAKNFSLYGYQRETNPHLKEHNVVTLQHSKSTATYTTASVHSILSYRGETSDSYEPLPSYLQRQGVEVIWRTNNWGEPKLKVSQYKRKSDLKLTCQGEGCAYDGVLLTGLEESLKSDEAKKIFYVLHTSGSHGPSYYKKYPKSFEHFKPVCKTVDLKQCTQEELVNAYDNTILYTDNLLGKIIDILKKEENRAALLIYISDHGESLGEYGLYLHGTPYSIAPDVQKKIPFIFWASKKFKEEKGIEKLDFTTKEYGQYNIFHSIMGAFDMNSSIYDKNLDIFHR